MKKYVLLLLTLFILTGLKAQNDSLKKIRLSGFQLDIGPNVYTNFKQQYQGDYRQYIKNDENLNVDLTGYKTQWGYFYNSFNGIPGFKLYGEINNRKRIRLEIFAGLRYSQEYSNGTHYTKSKYDTLGIYTNTSGQRIYQVLKNESSYNYEITSQKLIVPLGINFTTNKQRFFWITTGLEIAPAVNFNYVFQSTHSENYEEVFIHEGDSINSRYNYRQNLSGLGTWKNKRTKLDGTGFGFYAALPFTLYFHPFKRAAFLKHLNALASISPLFFYSHSKYSGDAHILTMSFTTGIRYNW